MTWIRLAIAVALGFLTTPRAGAGTIDLTATGQGWMTATMSNSTSAGNNYLAGNCGAGDCYTGEFRDFFQFAIPALDGPIISATLLLNTGSEALQQSASVTYQVTSVGPDFGFSDLATGSVYGSRTYAASDQNRVEGTTLDAAALADLLQAAGGTFTLGGRVTSSVSFGAGNRDELIFGRTDGAVPELRIVTGSAPMLLSTMLETDTAVPEPAPAAIIVDGVALIGLMRWKRSRDRKRAWANPRSLRQRSLTVAARKGAANVRNFATWKRVILLNPKCQVYGPLLYSPSAWYRQLPPRLARWYRTRPVS